MLIVNHIEKKFHKNLILNDVSFQVKPGEIIVLLGQSGVGKSTMLRVLCNLESFDAGNIILNDQQIDFSKVGMVFQDFNLFPHLTVLQNLTLALTHVAQKTEEQATHIALSMLGNVEMGAYAHGYPASLSGGQKQRVALARALCLNPAVLCLDEPTSALDPQLTSQVAQIIKKLAAQNMMLVIATHDISLLANLSCTIHLMQHGKIIQSATTAQLEQTPESFLKIKNFIDGKNNS
jgi:polar amino acid transport system ATP-binding protein